MSRAELLSLAEDLPCPDLDCGDPTCIFGRALREMYKSHEALAEALKEIADHLFERQDMSRCREMARAALRNAGVQL